MFTAKDGLINQSIENLFEDREGNIWACGTDGLDQFREFSVNTISVKQGLSSSRVMSVLGTRDGSVWIATSNGLDRWKDRLITVYSKPAAPAKRTQGDIAVRASGRAHELHLSGAPDKLGLLSLYEDPDGSLWVTHYEGYFRFQNERFSLLRLQNIEGARQAPVARDRAGNLWAAEAHGLYRLSEDRIAEHFPSTALGLNGNIAGLLAADPLRGGLWVGSWEGGLVYFEDGRVRAFYGPEQGLRAGRIKALLLESEDTLWAATDVGVSRIWNGRVATLNSNNGLPCDNAQDVTVDRDGSWWIYMDCGLIRITRPEMNAWITDPNRKVQVATFDVSDGLKRDAGIQEYGPRMTKAADGSIWFASFDGVSVVDPHRLSVNRLPPPVAIERITANGKQYSLAQGMRLPPRVRQLALEFTALSFVAPEKVRFRFRLDPQDPSWSDVTSDRKVEYSNLPPRHYRFRVVACNNSGVWNEVGDSLDFYIPPAWYQTLWFRAACVAAFLLLLWGIYQRRVHELAEQEKKFREAVETMPALAFIAEPGGKRTFVNRGWLEYTGFRQERASGFGWEQAIHPDDLRRVAEGWRAAEASSQPLAYETRMRRGSDGVYRWFQTRARPLFDRHGKVVKWCAVATDIEDRKRAEELQAELAHTNRVSMLGELASSISHDLNQPIAAAILNADLATRFLESNPPDLLQARQRTRRITEMGTLASEIIDRLRSLYKKEPPKRVSLAVSEVIGQMEELLRGQAMRHGVSLRTDLTDDPPEVVADRVQIQQVLMNLMLNGIEAMAETGGVLTVKADIRGDGQIEISVNDTGPGLPPGKAEQIFDAFFTTKPQGSGMGLAISKSIVESHGGRIWASGDAGHGATFHFTLPPVPVEAETPVTAT